MKSEDKKDNKKNLEEKSNEKIVKKSTYLKLITIAFQRRFRQDLINGIIDQECLLISKNLIKKIDKLS